VAITTTASAADDPQSFVEQEHHQLEQLLKQPTSSGRDGQIQHILDSMIDYDDLTRRAFGEPCPRTEQGCTDLWATYDDAKKAQLRGLLRRLVERTYRRNLVKTLDYDITYKGTKDLGGDSKVLTEAKSKVKTREPAVRVDYVVRQTSNGWKVVDLITEGSSLTKNYYDQFKKMDTYDQIVKRLEDRIANPSTK